MSRRRPRTAASSVTVVARIRAAFRTPTRPSKYRGYARLMATTETFESTSPADGATIGSFPRSTAADVDRAVATAKAAYDGWRLTPAPKRGEILFRVARSLEREKAALTDLVTHEMGKVKAE